MILKSHGCFASASNERVPPKKCPIAAPSPLVTEACSITSFTKSSFPYFNVDMSLPKILMSYCTSPYRLDRRSLYISLVKSPSSNSISFSLANM